ncbi:VTT domain-containing protein [Alicyclobacillus fastidiosus]|uniref:TVP38/TMEM64 family membrane protein n=1 Tax=Alicyclobacillus fastidiosus TaxID=392011 RepID=A0ABY6ZDB3_9BACL|nr:VTT domain-containing protein [Alicyclobacillus fastidiosus]WAH40879.1 VTT domain-containing protein [Alicyclobacillus fastidiosus]GMA62369.1 hypothetical protein GCM10025859_28090 [Alicyclobacillus fastidiosus]
MRFRGFILRILSVLSLLACLVLIRIPYLGTLGKHGHGLWGGLMFVALQAIASILPIPSEPVMTACLRAQGLVAGTIENWLGALAGGVTLFLVGRIALPSISRLVHHPRAYPTYRRMLDRLQPGGFWALVVIQLLPLPFLAVNLILGAIPSVSLRAYALASGLSMAPYQLAWALVYIGVMHTKHLALWMVLLAVGLAGMGVIYRMAKIRTEK